MSQYLRAGVSTSPALALCPVDCQVCIIYFLLPQEASESPAYRSPTWQEGASRPRMHGFCQKSSHRLSRICVRLQVGKEPPVFQRFPRGRPDHRKPVLPETSHVQFSASGIRAKKPVHPLSAGKNRSSHNPSGVQRPDRTVLRPHRFFVSMAGSRMTSAPSSSRRSAIFLLRFFGLVTITLCLPSGRSSAQWKVSARAHTFPTTISAGRNDPRSVGSLLQVRYSGHHRR